MTPQPQPCVYHKPPHRAPPSSLPRKTLYRVISLLPKPQHRLIAHLRLRLGPSSPTPTPASHHPSVRSHPNFSPSTPPISKYSRMSSINLLHTPSNGSPSSSYTPHPTTALFPPTSAPSTASSPSVPPPPSSLSPRSAPTKTTILPISQPGHQP